MGNAQDPGQPKNMRKTACQEAKNIGFHLRPIVPNQKTDIIE